MPDTTQPVRADDQNSSTPEICELAQSETVSLPIPKAYNIEVEDEHEPDSLEGDEVEAAPLPERDLPSESEGESPFIVEIEGHESSPQTKVIVTAGFRESGFWRQVPAEVLRDLLFVVTFVRPHGSIAPSLHLLAKHSDCNLRTMLARMKRLDSFTWRGRPLVTTLTRENGDHAYIPSPRLVTYRHVERVKTKPEPLLAAPREAVISWSRQQYGRPRAIVEQEIEEQLRGVPGVSIPEPIQQIEGGTELFEKLVKLRVSHYDAERLLTSFGAERVKRQLAWLPYRHANLPERYLVAAIEDDYEEPTRAKEKRLRSREDQPDLGDSYGA